MEIKPEKFRPQYEVRKIRVGELGSVAFPETTNFLGLIMHIHRIVVARIYKSTHGRYALNEC